MALHMNKGEGIKDDYIKNYKSRTCIVIQKKARMMNFLFMEFLSFFKRSIPSGIFQFNHAIYYF